MLRKDSCTTLPRWYPIVTTSTGSACRGSEAMKARQRIAGASYGPDELETLAKAFDDAWERVSPHVSTDATEAARLTLADIILGLAKQGTFDPERLADAAVQLILGAPSKRRH